MAEGDLVTVHFTALGTHEGEFKRVQPTGREISTLGISIQRIENDKITEEWEVFDMFGMLRQRGIVEA